MRFTPGLFALCLPTLIVGSVITNLECLIVVEVVDVLRACSTATSFCSSYLGISTQSVTVTSTTTASETISTTVVTGSTTVYPITSTITNTATATVTSCPADGELAPTAKRDLLERGIGKVWPTPSGLKFPTAEISKACSCLHIPTPTTTITLTPTVTNTVISTIDVITTIDSTSIVVTSTTTTTTVCSIPTSCNNVGLQWAFYSNPDQIINSGDNCAYDTFFPEALKDAQVLDSGSTTYVDISGSGFSQLYIYGHWESPSIEQYYAVNHRGYILAPFTGTYTYTATEADEILVFWQGPLAYSGWTRENANAVLPDDDCGTEIPETYNFDLVGGQYYPIRIVYANAQSGASCANTLTAPDGTVLIGPESGPSPWIVQFSCDGVSAPPYPQFGQET